MSEIKATKEVLAAKAHALPTVDFDCRFSARKLQSTRCCSNLFELLHTDPYAPLLRAAGIAKAEISGDAADFEKYEALLAAASRLSGTALLEVLSLDLAVLGCKLPQNDAEAAAAWQHVAAELSSRNVTLRDATKDAACVLLPVSPLTLPEFAPPVPNAHPVLDLAPLFAFAERGFAATVAEFCQKKEPTLADLEAALCDTLSRFAAMGGKVILVDFAAFTHFEKPNPYHAGKALAACLAGERLTDAESSLLLAQLLRSIGRAAAPLGLLAKWRFAADFTPVSGDMMARELEKLLSYLNEYDALLPTLLSHTVLTAPCPFAALIGKFATEDGTPRLFFGFEGVCATQADIRFATLAYLRRGAAKLLLGITGSEMGGIVPASTHFYREAVAEVLSAWGEENPAVTEENILSALRDLSLDNALRFLGEK